MEFWGEIKLLKITDGNDFWNLFEELVDDKSDFIQNKNFLLESYRDGNLYTLYVEENLWMFRNNIEEDPIFCKGNGSEYILPCFCIKEDKKAMIIWVHSRARRKGLGSRLVKLLEIEEVYNPLPTSLPFWDSLSLI